MIHLNEAFIENSNTMDDVYNNIDNCNLKIKLKILIVFDDIIADIKTNKKFQSMVEELFFRCRILNISLVYITQSYFLLSKDVRLNSTYYLIIKIHNKRELRHIGNNHQQILIMNFLQIFTENIHTLPAITL